jgi:hypothetical protein
MSITVSNTIQQVGFKGQGVRIYLDQSDTVNNLPLIEVGMPASVDSDIGYDGYIYSVDYFGNSFIVMPNMPSTIPGTINPCVIFIN